MNCNIKDKYTDNTWNIFRPSHPEPYPLWKLYVFSMIITIILFFIAALVAYNKHSWNKQPELNCKTKNCWDQKNYWESIIAKARHDSFEAEKRIKKLKEIRTKPGESGNNQTWEWFDKELKSLEKIVNKPEKLIIYPLSKSAPFTMFLIILSQLFYLFFCRIVALHARSTHLNFIIYDWVKIHFIFGLIITMSMISAEICTSVLAVKKTWFGWDSYYVTQLAFTIKCFAFFPFGIVAATPFTLLWCLTRKEIIPSPNAMAADGKFGVGRYVDFLQTWSLWLILAPSTLGVIWIRFIFKMELHFSYARLLYGIGVGSIITLIIVRLIRNAIFLRFRCEEELIENKSKLKNGLPEDPTIKFLGTEWWKLPATISVALASIGVFVEWLGITDVLMNIIQ